MYKDWLFTTHVYTITLPTMATPFYIVPFGDVHKGAKNHADQIWGNFCSHYKARQKKDVIYYLGMGDYNDIARTTVRKRLTHAELEDGVLDILDHKARKETRDFAKDIFFMRDRLIGLLEGNHMWEYQDGTSSGQELCERLRTTYLGYTTYIHLMIKSKKDSSCISFGIFASHGKGGNGKLLGTSINKVDDMRSIIPNATIYLMGHDHRKMANSSAILHPTIAKGKATLKQQQQWFGRTGGYLKGYVENQSSYLVNMMARPVPLGNIEFKVQIHDMKVNGNRGNNFTVQCIT